ncbi:ABC transporter substrate-binding protein [Bdellovibrionota bacterium FG-2]
MGLFFRALTRIDANLNPQADLAQSWQSLDAGHKWKFTIAADAKDHASQTITPTRIAACLEQYRIGDPPALMRGGFPNWISTTADSNSVTLEFSAPNPYLARDVTVLKFFQIQGESSPCTEPKTASVVIGSGAYFPKDWALNPQNEMLALPTDKTKLPIGFVFTLDENAKSIKLLRGEVDVAQNALSLTKTDWVARTRSEQFRLIERPGVQVSYLAFNFRDPILAKKAVRLAIAHAINRDEYIKNKLAGHGSKAGSFLSPYLEESAPSDFSYDPKLSEQLLDEAGYPRGDDGTRLHLKYKATPSREGIDTALVFKSMLGKVGIDLTVEIVEPAVFFALIRKGNFQLYSSRWIGISDSSILYRTLHSKSPNNRVKYANPEIDALLDQSRTLVSLSARKPVIAKVQKIMAEELPYFPLWFWTNIAIVRKDLKGLEDGQISLSGSLVPLTELKW